MTSVRIDEAPSPGTDDWRKLISASKVSAILGISPWTSQYRLWHEMAGNLEPDDPSDSMKKIFDWGHSAELAIRDWWLRQNPTHTLSDGEVAYMDDSVEFPHLVTLDLEGHSAEFEEEDGDGRYIVECKTANSIDSLNKWGHPSEEDAIPAPYLVQVLFQMRISGIRRAFVVMQCMGAPSVYVVKWDEEMADAIVERCAEFWKSVDSGVEPPLDDSKATLDAVRGIHTNIEKGTEYSISSGEAMSLLWAKEAEDDATKRLNLLKSNILVRMLKAQRLVCNGNIVATRVAGRGTQVNLRFNNKAKEAIFNGTV